jgi:uncharacterized membrane protein required for colicin V production
MTWTWLGAVTLGFLALACIMGFKRGFVREVVSTFIMLLTLVIVWMVNPYVNDFIRENTPIYEKIQSGCREIAVSLVGNAEIVGAAEQSALIDNLNLPTVLKDNLKENNTAEKYRYLAATTFVDYISGYFAELIINVLSFLFSLLLVTILIRIITGALNLLSRLPVLNGVNKLAGAVLGGTKCILFIWIAFLILTVLCNTEIGKQGLKLIEEDYLLNFLYGKNILAQIFAGIF